MTRNALAGCSAALGFALAVCASIVQVQLLLWLSLVLMLVVPAVLAQKD